MATLSKDKELKTTFPQVSLQHALESAFQIYAAEPDSRAIPEDRFRRLLGYDRTNGNSVRLIVGMRDYGLVERRKNAYTLSAAALGLFTAKGLPEFRAGLYRAAMLPELMGELLARYGTKLDTRELDDDLRGRKVADKDRKIIRTVLRDNEELIRTDTRAAALFGRFQAAAPHVARPGVLGWLGGAAFWMKSLPGRTANLTLVALVFVGSLLYFALRPGPAGTLSARQVTPPVPTVSDGAGGPTPLGASPASTPTTQTSAPPGAASTTGTASSAASGALLGTLLTGADAGVASGSAASETSTPAPGGGAPGGAANVPATSPGAGPAGRSPTTAAQPRDPTRTPGTGKTAGRQSAQGPSALSPSTQKADADAPTADAVTSRPPTETAGTPAASPRIGPPPARSAQSTPAASPPPATPQPNTQTGRPAASAPATAPAPQPAPPVAQPAPVNPTTSLTTTAPGASVPDAVQPRDLMARGQELANLLYSQNLTRLWEAFTPPVRAEWNGFSAFKAYRMGGLNTYGAEARVISEELRESGGVTYYVRTSIFERGPGTAWSLILGMNPAGQVVEFNIVSAGVLPGVAISSVR